jgi:cobalt/nickel transport protein
MAMTMTMTMTKRNGLLLAAAVVIGAVPLFMGFHGKGSFAGSDDQAAAAIEQIRPGYQPWFTPLWQPPSSEVASLLFALQAAAGAGVLGYYLGLKRGEAKPRDGDAVHGTR